MCIITFFPMDFPASGRNGRAKLFYGKDLKQCVNAATGAPRMRGSGASDTEAVLTRY